MQSDVCTLHGHRSIATVLQFPATYSVCLCSCTTLQSIIVDEFKSLKMLVKVVFDALTPSYVEFVYTRILLWKVM